jgi:hypothetical protein
LLSVDVSFLQVEISFWLTNIIQYPIVAGSCLLDKILFRCSLLKISCSPLKLPFQLLKPSQTLLFAAFETLISDHIKNQHYKKHHHLQHPGPQALPTTPSPHPPGLEKELKLITGAGVFRGPWLGLRKVLPKVP